MSERQYFRRIKAGILCGKRKQKEMLASIRERVAEKREDGKSMEEIIREIGAPEEVCEEINACLAEEGLLLDRRMLTSWKICRAVNYISLLLVLSVILFMYVRQNSILQFVNAHADADAFFMAGPQGMGAPEMLLIVLCVIFVGSLSTALVLRRKMA